MRNLDELTQCKEMLIGVSCNFIITTDLFLNFIYFYCFEFGDTNLLFTYLFLFLGD